jgi:hypothetical protein
MNYNVFRIIFAIFALYSIIKSSLQTQKKENSNVIIVGIPPIRNPLRFGKREENFSYMKTRFFHQPKELKWSQSYLKKKKKNANKTIQHIIDEMIEIFKRK